MKTKTFFTSAVIALFLVITFTSCEKEKDTADTINVSNSGEVKIDFTYTLDTSKSDVGIYINGSLTEVRKRVIYLRLKPLFYNVPIGSKYNFQIQNYDRSYVGQQISKDWLYKDFKEIEENQLTINDDATLFNKTGFVILKVYTDKKVYECYKNIEIDPTIL